VLEEVVKTHPDKRLILYAYSQYQSPPARVVPHPNLLIHYCLLTDHHGNRKIAERDFGMLSAWGDSGVKHLAIYDYFIRGGWPDLPRPFPHLVQESVRQSQAAGGRYYQTQHGDGYAINGINYYALGKLLWDPSVDAKEIERQYLLDLFPRAATRVQRYFDRLAAGYRESACDVMLDGAQFNHYRPIVQLYSEPVLEACRQDLAEASALAEGAEAERVKRLHAGLNYTELTVQAIRATIPLLEAGWRLQGKVVPPPEPDMQAFHRALTAWQARDQFVHSQTNNWVLAVMWIEYNNLNHGWNPRRAMEKYLIN
jgi:hypothetical protein